MRVGAAMLLCGRAFLPHRGAGDCYSPTLCLYLPRSPTIAQFDERYKEIFRQNLTQKAALRPQKARRPNYILAKIVGYGKIITPFSPRPNVRERG